MNKFFRDIHSIETGEEEVPRESVESLRNIHFDGYFFRPLVSVISIY